MKKKDFSPAFFACSACNTTFRDVNGEPAEKKKVDPSEKIEADCPLGCGKQARRYEGPYGAYWRCSCVPKLVFKDVNGKPVVKEERPQEKCPVKGCKGTAQQFTTKDGGRLFWKCGTCQNMFNDVDGKPAIREKIRKESA
jgi:transposase-like protein